MSERFTITVSDEMGEWVESATETGEFDSKSEVAQEGLSVLRRLKDEEADVEEVLAARDRADELADELDRVEEEHEAEVDQLQAKVDDLQRQLAAANQRIDTTNELVRAVESQQSLDERRAQAGLVTRTKWWLFGMDEREKDD